MVEAELLRGVVAKVPGGGRSRLHAVGAHDARVSFSSTSRCSQNNRTVGIHAGLVGALEPSPNSTLKTRKRRRQAASRSSTLSAMRRRYSPTSAQTCALFDVAELRMGMDRSAWEVEARTGSWDSCATRCGFTGSVWACFCERTVKLLRIQCKYCVRVLTSRQRSRAYLSKSPVRMSGRMEKKIERPAAPLRFRFKRAGRQEPLTFA